MQELFTAVYSKFTADSTLFNSVDGRMYNTEAEKGLQDDYIVFSLPSGVPEYWFNDEQVDDIIIQFNIFSIKNADTDIQTIFTNLKNVYNNTTLTVSGYTFFKMELIFYQLTRPPLENTYQYTVQYLVQMEKN